MLGNWVLCLNHISPLLVIGIGSQLTFSHRTLDFLDWILNIKREILVDINLLWWEGRWR